ncbi:MAG: ATP-binding cassette domain-containing protein, partial [Candidatus Bathyarchaeota archaeon]|nr:ATP-binding cassette domain-containing protein [Candidatus Bathyarchaeota archaeon]
MLLEVKDLIKIYNIGLLRRKEIVAVKNVSFNVKPREFISLVGESGSGKTTTAKIILRLIKPTSGLVMFEGKNIFSDIKTLEERRQYWSKVHGVFQDPYASFNPLHKIDRILEQVFTLMRNSNFDKRDIIREALKEVGLRPEEVLGKYPHELSGG